MGEDEHLALQAQVATHEAELRQLQRQEQESRAATNRAMETGSGVACDCILSLHVKSRVG